MNGGNFLYPKKQLLIQAKYIILLGMSIAVDEILEKAKKLSREEKADLADFLFEEFETDLLPSAEIDEAWFIEVKRREAAALAGKSESIPWNELKEKLETRRI